MSACLVTFGRGGLPLMMGTAIPEDTRCDALTKREHEEKEKGTEGAEGGQPPDTDALNRPVITEGLDSAGKPLDWTMPRWRMSAQDVEDLLAYLRRLK